MDISQEIEGHWSVRDAKSKLSEVLRRARVSGPQFIGARDACVLVSREEWEARTGGDEPLSTWLLKHSPGIEIPLPKRGESNGRALAFDEVEG